MHQTVVSYREKQKIRKLRKLEELEISKEQHSRNNRELQTMLPIFFKGLCYNLDKEGVPDSKTMRFTFAAMSRTAFICKQT